jgi:hypothetical protein
MLAVASSAKCNFWTASRGRLGCKRGRSKPGYHNGGAANVPKHRCAAGVAPQNLLFPAWLPGTVEDFTPETIARQLAVAWCSGVAGVAGIGWLPGTVFGGGALLEADAFEYRRGDVDSLQCRPSHSFRCDSDGQAHRRRRSTSGISAVGRRLPVSADFQDADSASCKARRSSLVRSSPSSSATRSTTVPSGKVVGSSRTRRPSRHVLEEDSLGHCTGFQVSPQAYPLDARPTGPRHIHRTCSSKTARPRPSW